MINPVCCYCEEELEEQGAILLSPPEEEGMVEKHHVCKHCYKRIRPECNLELVKGE